MLFNKYQYNNSNIRKRGYSQTCQVQDASGNFFWVKWILGIDKSSTKAKILADKLRHLQKAKHASLPEIIEYGFDEEQQTFAIIFQHLFDIDTLENSFRNIKTQNLISGLIELADCLNELHQKFKINHGDIHPANILVDNNGQFYLIDFGLSDITKTLSQEKDLEIFAKDFAAPEKLNRLVSNAFPYQSDIYSFGKIIDWFFHTKQENLPEEQNRNLQKLLAENPNDRPNWQQVIEILKNFVFPAEREEISIAFRINLFNSFLQSINENKPIFDVSPNKPNNANISCFMDIILGQFYCEGVMWVKDEKKLLFNTIKPITSIDSKVIERKKKEGKRLPFDYIFTLEEYPRNKADLTPIFQKWFEQKQKQHSMRENRKAVKEELVFYRELLEKEKDVIAKNSLRLQYYSYKVSDDEVTFNIKPNEKYSNVGVVLKHIEEGNDVNSEGFEYVVSANADRKQNKEVVEFAGKPYDWVQITEDDKLDESERKYALKIKDCEHLKKDNIPQSGYLFENTAKKEEEKNRQLDAIRKVDKNEVQNPDLIYRLFKPDDLPISSSDYSPLETVWQKDKDNQPLVYSDNQNKAIRNSLTKSPFSIIQGPPGTGKTTVITEIVFQILAQKPEAKVLITSQTNNAVDQVLENLLKNNISILRLSGITAPKVPAIREHTMDRKLSGWKKQVRETAEKNFKLQSEHYKSAFSEQVFTEELKDLHRDWINTITSLDEKSAINQKLIDSIRVIGATCNHIAAKKYSKYNFEFDYVIMDESGKATTAEALVPIILGKNLIFVGDHRQLRPMLTTTREVESWLRDKFKNEADELENWEDYFNRPSLFEQVITNIDYDYKAQLTECRRSSEEQVLLTSQCFYESEGDDAIEPVEREQEREHNLPLAIDSSIIFVDIGSHYKNESENKSSYNTESVKLIPEILELLNKCDKVKEYSFGIITGYTAQFRKLRNKIKGKELRNVRKWNKPEEKLTVSVVDRFQGLERDIVIVDLVKSGVGVNLGFLETPNRINVALSRQKRLLIIVGDYYSIVNAKTRNGEKVALQLYLEKIKPEWIVKAEDIKGLFPFKSDLREFEREEKKQVINDVIIKTDTTEQTNNIKPDVAQNLSLNLNVRDIDLSENKTNETWLTGNRSNPKIGVLELSTKAIKLLLCNDQKTLKEKGFSFNLFDRQSERTETGKGLDENNQMNMRFFNSQVIPKIRKYVGDAKRQGVDVLYSVATAAYRTATNRDDILQCIKAETNLNVAILSKAEEADTTLWAYIHSTKHREAFLKSPNIILVDQGGGSTEISFFENQKLIESNSLEVGTTALRNMLFSLSDLSLQDAFQQVDSYSITQMHNYLHSLKINTFSKEIYYIGVGKSIQWVAGTNNREQHDKVISLDKVSASLNKIDNEFVSKYTVNQIQRNADKNGTFPSNLDMRLGLPLVIELMKHCNIQNVHVSGTGLWYGVFFKEFYGIK